MSALQKLLLLLEAAMLDRAVNSSDFVIMFGTNSVTG